MAVPPYECTQALPSMSLHIIKYLQNIRDSLTYLYTII